MKQKKNMEGSKALKYFAVPMLSDYCKNVTTVRLIGHPQEQTLRQPR
jgi:hypothetical protein